MGIKDPREALIVNSLRTGTVSVVKGSAAISAMEAEAVARKDVKW